MGSRLGAAFILVGLISLAVFLVTFSAGQADPLTLLGGAALCALGLLVRRRSASRAEARSGRFQTLRRLLGSDEETE